MASTQTSNGVAKSNRERKISQLLPSPFINDQITSAFGSPNG